MVHVPAFKIQENTSLQKSVYYIAMCDKPILLYRLCVCYYIELEPNSGSQ